MNRLSATLTFPYRFHREGGRSVPTTAEPSHRVFRRPLPRRFLQTEAKASATGPSAKAMLETVVFGSRGIVINSVASRCQAREKPAIVSSFPSSHAPRFTTRDRSSQPTRGSFHALRMVARWNARRTSSRRSDRP